MNTRLLAALEHYGISIIILIKGRKVEVIIEIYTLIKSLIISKVIKTFTISSTSCNILINCTYGEYIHLKCSFKLNLVNII